MNFCTLWHGIIYGAAFSIYSWGVKTFGESSELMSLQETPSARVSPISPCLLRKSYDTFRQSGQRHTESQTRKVNEILSLHVRSRDSRSPVAGHSGRAAHASEWRACRGTLLAIHKRGKIRVKSNPQRFSSLCMQCKIC